MVRLKPTQRAVLVDKVPDLATVAAGALVFGQAVSGGTFSIGLALVGVGVWLVFMLFAVVLSGQEEQ